MAAALGPDGALDERRLQFTVDAEDFAVAVDVQLRVEERVAVRDALGDAEGDGDGGGAAGGAEGIDFRGGCVDNEGLFSVLGERGDLFEGWVAFGEILWSCRSQQKRDATGSRNPLDNQEQTSPGIPRA